MDWGIHRTVWRDGRTGSALGAYLGSCLLRLEPDDRMACPDLPKRTYAQSCQHSGYTLDGSDAVGTRAGPAGPRDACFRHVHPSHLQHHVAMLCEPLGLNSKTEWGGRGHHEARKASGLGT